MLALVALLMPTIASAQSEPPVCGNEVTVEGSVVERGASAILIQVASNTSNPQRLQLVVNQQTLFRDTLGNSVSRDLFVPGTSIRVRYCSESLLALRVDLRTNTTPVCTLESDTEGIIAGLNPETRQLTVGEAVYAITDTTNFRDSANQAIQLSAFHAGDRVRVRYCVTANALPRVLVLTLLANNQEAESEGAITAISDRPLAITVGDRLWAISNTTRIVNDNGAPVSTTALRVGVVVSVEGLIPGAEAPSYYRALRVEIHATEDDGDREEIRIVGPIVSINAEEATLVVNGVQVITTDATMFKVKPRSGETREIEFSDLTVGRVVVVEGLAVRQVTIAIFPPPPPAIEAVVVIVQEDLAPPPPPPPAEHFGIRGYLQRVTDGGALVLTNGTVRTSDETRFFDAPTSSTITLTDLIPGDFLHIEGVASSAGRLALSVVRTNPVGVPVTAFGEIRAVGENRLRVGDRTFVLTDETLVFGPENAELTLADLAVGQRVEVIGSVLPERLPVAERVTIRSTPRPVCRATIDFRGLITAKGQGSLVVGERTVTVTNTTEILNRDGRPLPFAELAVGMAVKVEGVPASTATAGIVACEIKILGEDPTGPPPATQIVGVATEVNPSTNSLVIRNVTILVSETTRIEARRDDSGTTRTLADIQVGDHLVVRGNLMADGTFQARLIVIQEERTPPPPPVIAARITGIVTGMDLPTSLTVNRTTILIPTEGEFEIEGLDGEVSSLEDLSVGDLVVVKGRATAERTITAREIEVRAAILANIDTTAKVLTLNGLDVRTTTGTIYLTRTTIPPSRITFDDLAVGDLIRLRALRSNTAGGLVAREVVQLRTSSFVTEPGDGYVPPIPGVEDGRPTLTTENNTDTFGYIGLAESAFPIEDNALYEIIARVRGNVANHSDVPTVRLRSNNANFQRGSEFVVESVDDASFVPTPQGREIRSYFVPAAPPTSVSQLLRSWFASLDVINFGGLNAAVARFRLDDIRVNAIPLSRVHVAETLVDESFDSGPAGWVFNALGGRYTTPVSNSDVAGSLDLVPVELNSVGWWTGDTGVTIEGNALYRGRFLVRSAATSTARVPTFRVRLNLRSFQLASVVVVSSTGNGEDSPTAEGRLYDVYLYVPGTVAASEGMIASIDLVHTESDDEFVPVSLDHFTLEKLEILPE
ncbi:hypothetical protein GC173_09980 [bacterium]|nr:hypothetical protein [bacterium]